MSPRQQRGKETHSHILETATRCFAEQGYDATGVAAICKCAGVTKGAFYHHFPSKHALFLELFERWLSALDAQLLAFRTEAATIPEALRQMAGMMGQVFQEASGQVPMFLEFWNKAARDPETWQATIAPYRRYRDFFATAIRTGIDEGSLRPVDPETAAQALVSLAVGLMLQGVLDPNGADWGEAAEQSVNMFLEGIEQRA